MNKIISVVLILVIMITVTACTIEVNTNSQEHQNNKVIVTSELTEEESKELLLNLELLPVGTVIQIKGLEDKLMIIGLMQMRDGDQSILYDYSAVLYPEGLINSDENYLFNKDQIIRVYHCGYIDDEGRAYHEKIIGLRNDYYNSQKED